MQSIDLRGHLDGDIFYLLFLFKKLAIVLPITLIVLLENFLVTCLIGMVATL